MTEDNKYFPGVDIVLVNWNSGVQLKNALESIHLYAANIQTTAYIVDNNSSDGSADYLASTDIHLIKNPVNVGFGKACNQGAHIGKREYLLFLNPDAALMENGLQRCLSFLQDKNHGDYAICGAQLIDEEGRVARTCAKFPSAFGMFSKTIGLDKLRPQLSHFMVDWDHKESRQVDQVMGAFFLIRRSVFETLQGFDEDFFVYYEELDLSNRAFKIGWKTMYLAEAQAFHAGGGTSKNIKAKRLFYSLRSKIIYANKHYGFFSFLLVLFSTLFIEPVSRISIAIAKRSYRNLQETCQGYKMLYRWLPQWFLTGATR